MGLKPPEENLIICSEGASRRGFLRMFDVLIKLIRLYRDSAMGKIFKEEKNHIHDPYQSLPEKYKTAKDPLDTIRTELCDAINNDSVGTVFSLLQIVSVCGSAVGLPILDQELALAVKIPANLTFQSLGSVLYRKVYSEKMRLNVMSLALQQLYKMVSDKPGSDVAMTETLSSAIMNYVKTFSYPRCNRPFREVANVAKEPAFTLRELAMADLPKKGFDHIWRFCEPVQGQPQVWEYLEFLAPYIVIAALATNNWGKLTITPEQFRAMIEAALQNVGGWTKILNDELRGSAVDKGKASVTGDVNVVGGKCTICGKETMYPLVTTCCCSYVCNFCVQKAFIRTTSRDIYCVICTRKRVGLLVTAPFATVALDLPSLKRAFAAMKEARNNSVSNVHVEPDSPASSYLSLPNRTTGTELMEFYLPVCLLTMGLKFEEHTSPPTDLIGASIVAQDKIETIKQFLVMLRRECPSPKVLLYHPYADVGESLAKETEKVEYKCDLFNAASGELYRNAKDPMLIICNSVGQVAGFNMEYLDAVIFYSPPPTIDVKTQIVGRGERLGRNPNHVLHVLTLYYQREVQASRSRVTRLCDTSLWKKDRERASREKMSINDKKTVASKTADAMGLQADTIKMNTTVQTITPKVPAESAKKPIEPLNIPSEQVKPLPTPPISPPISPPAQPTPPPAQPTPPISPPISPPAHVESSEPPKNPLESLMASGSGKKKPLIPIPPPPGS
jgi:hypothetical protein